jgi:hypothetical protein
MFDVVALFIMFFFLTKPLSPVGDLAYTALGARATGGLDFGRGLGCLNWNVIPHLRNLPPGLRSVGLFLVSPGSGMVPIHPLSTTFESTGDVGLRWPCSP